MQKFKIFYSWQSDLPGNKTRNFIRACIDDAVELALESEAIEAERDEATMGTTGSPNIVSTLFSKIDNCDLFIADISLCFTESQKANKKSPNPNVLLELGYAVKTLGWERIICLCNTDYGNQYPFDIAHNRITDFSLDGKSKNEVKGNLAKVIFINIRDIRIQVPRAKEGMATHVIGAYNFASHMVTKALEPIDISKQEGYTLHNEELMDEASTLLSEIQAINSRMKVINVADDKCQTTLVEQPALSNKIEPQLSEAIHGMAESFKGAETPVVWTGVEEDKARIKYWFNIDVPDEFFDMGKLKQVVQLLGDSKLSGTDDEKTKHDKLHELSYKLLLLDVRTNYLKTFEDMYFIPLAIQNISPMQDTNIHVIVSVELGEIIEPNEHLIWRDCEGFQGVLCRDDDDEKDVGIICELFAPKEDGFIHIEDIPFEPPSYIPKTPIFTINELSQPEKTAEDYKLELEDFIASTAGRGYYEFDVANLRPNECRWLCCGMLIRPEDGLVKVRYQIHSSHSSGDLNGIIEMTVD